MTRILSVDDEPELLELLTLILKRSGYESHTTTDNLEALHRLCFEPVDLVTEDLMRPGMDGWEFYQLMKAEPVLCDTPVIIITAKAQSIDRVLGLHVAKTDVYITKPFRPQELIDGIRTVLRQQAEPLLTEKQRTQRPTLRRPKTETCLTFLSDPSSAIRRQAVLALGRSQDVRAVEPIIELLHDEAHSVRLAAMRALAWLSDPRAVEPLTRALQDKAPVVRWSAAVALAHFRDGRAIELLIRALDHESDDIRVFTCLALGEAHDSHAVEPLIAALKDRDTRVRLAATFALGKIGDPRAIGSLLPMLQDGSIRDQAAGALVNIGPASVEPLAELLSKHKADTHIVTATANALQNPDDVRAIGTFIDTLDESVAAAVIEALGKIRDARAVEPLIALLQDGHWETRQAATRALGQLQDARAAEALVEALRHDNSNWPAAEALANIGDKRAIEPLIAMLGGQSQWTRESAAKALGHFNTAHAAEALIGLLRDEEPGVRGAAAQALGQTKDARALTELDWLAQEDDECTGQLIRIGDIAARAAAQIRASLA